MDEEGITGCTCKNVKITKDKLPIKQRQADTHKRQKKIGRQKGKTSLIFFVFRVWPCYFYVVPQKQQSILFQHEKTTSKAKIVKSK